MPRIVVIIDEISGIFAEESILHILQSGRATGIHLVASTSSCKTLSREIRSSFGSKITFAVGTSSESKAILGYSGAEKLSGFGEAIYAPLGGGRPVLVKSCFADTEIDRVIDYVKENIADVCENVALRNSDNNHLIDPRDTYCEEDEMLPQAIECVVETGQASTSDLQRRLKLGYARAVRIIDQLEERGIVGPYEGSKPRQVLLSKERWFKMKLSGYK